MIVVGGQRLESEKLPSTSTSEAQRIPERSPLARLCSLAVTCLPVVLSMSAMLLFLGSVVILVLAL